MNIVSPLWLFPFFCCLCQSWISPPQGREQFPWKDSVVSAGLRSLEMILSNGLFIQPTYDGCAYLREVYTVITVATSMVQTTLLIKYWCTCSVVKYFYANTSENLIWSVKLLTSLQIPSFGVCPSAMFLLWRYSSTWGFKQKVKHFTVQRWSVLLTKLPTSSWTTVSLFMWATFWSDLHIANTLRVSLTSDHDDVHTGQPSKLVWLSALSLVVASTTFMKRD